MLSQSCVIQLLCLHYTCTPALFPKRLFIQSYTEYLEGSQSLFNSLWLCWWACSDPYHFSVQLNALYPPKFSSPIFFATRNCFRTPVQMNQQAAYFVHSGCMRISLRCWVLQAINRSIRLYLRQWSRTWCTVCAY